jgi:crotonobetainyl-CoA:carnitine CoA-transferase CaiB-like acyl-CoA transferase
LTRENSEQQQKLGPLEGIKVVEYAVFHAGPGACSILGDLGAEVIKVESIAGDLMRDWRRIGADHFVLSDGESMFFQIANRSKKSISLDIKTKNGREIFLELIKEADVFLTNLRKSTKIKYGIDYSTLSKVNPKLIHASVSGYGPEGPVSDLGAYDPMGQARSGMMFISGQDEPVLIQIAVLDQFTSIAASHAIITALFQRERCGTGQEVHASLYGSALWLMYVNMQIESFGLDSKIVWDRKRNLPVRNSFCCKDGKWIVAVHHPEERYWPLICKATGLEKLLDDSRFIDYDRRIANCNELMDIFDSVFVEKTRDEWIDILTVNGLMFSPVQTLNEVLTDPQAIENGYVVDFDHPSYGKIKMPGYPLHFSQNTAGTKTAAPKLGEHTDEIMSRMGYSLENIKKMKKEKIVK